MNLIKKIIKGEGRLGKVFDYTIQIFIFLSLALLSIETLPNLTVKQREILNFIELVIILIFSLEYCLRLYVAPKKFKFVFSFLGIVDLLAILPFYLAGLDLKAIRFVRLFRIIRLLKLTRYNNCREFTGKEELQRIFENKVRCLKVFGGLLCCAYYIRRLAKEEI